MTTEGARKTPTSSAPGSSRGTTPRIGIPASAITRPEIVHYCLAAGSRERRAAVLEATYAAHPERFIRAIDAAADMPRPQGARVDLDGANATARHIVALMSGLSSDSSLLPLWTIPIMA